MNQFDQCLKQSHAAADMPFWKDCYRMAFPTIVAMQDHRQNGEHQRQGIDRSIVLDNGTCIWVDEKVRGRNRITGRVYEDIALEEWSSLERKTPGWVVKSLLAHYIAYAIAPLGKCYLLPVLQLQESWRRNSQEWKQRFFEIRAVNEAYTTICWAIPPPVLFKAIGTCLRVQFQPLEIDE